MKKKIYESPILEVISFEAKESLANGTGIPGEENEGALSDTGWPYNYNLP